MGEPDYGPKSWVPDELELNAAVNMVSSIRPRNEVEAALAAQTFAVHIMTMKLAAQSMRWGHVDASSMALAGKLARNTPQQAGTMAKLKGRTGKQKISVRYERYDHKHDHEHLHASNGGGSDLKSQPQAPRADTSDRPRRLQGSPDERIATLPCSDSEREPLPRANGERPELL